MHAERHSNADALVQDKFNFASNSLIYNIDNALLHVGIQRSTRIRPISRSQRTRVKKRFHAESGCAYTVTYKRKLTVSGHLTNSIFILKESEDGIGLESAKAKLRSSPYSFEGRVEHVSPGGIYKNDEDALRKAKLLVSEVMGVIQNSSRSSIA